MSPRPGFTVKAGVEPGAAAALTGHTVKAMLRSYQGVDDDDRREAAEQAKLGELVDAPRKAS